MGAAPITFTAFLAAVGFFEKKASAERARVKARRAWKTFILQS